MDFHGVKIALLFEDKILIYLRDNKPDLNYAGLWDLPGGGREGSESPIETIIREVDEEFGITLRPEQIFYEKSYPSMVSPDIMSWFMVGNITPEQVQNIQFGSEGQSYELVTIQNYLSLDLAVKPLQHSLYDFLAIKTPSKL